MSKKELRKEELRVEELKQQWHEAAKNHAANAWDLFNEYFDAKFELACETTGFNEACNKFVENCDRLAKNNKEIHEITINGLEKSAANFKKAAEYSNATIAMLKEINC